MSKAFDQVWKSITGMPKAKLTRYRFVKYTTDGNLIVAHTLAGEAAVGVAYEPNDVGQPTQIVNSGFAFIELGATLTAGQSVMSNATGQAVAYDSATAANRRLGMLVVGGGSGDIGTVLLG